MNRERWGTFSVRDHVGRCPFAVEVLMYDRLVIPRPDSGEERWWYESGWDPDRLDDLLAVLGTYSPRNPGGRAVPVAWNRFTEELFHKRAETAKIVGEEASYQLTRRLLAGELLPEAPPGVARVAVLAAYPSQEAVAVEWPEYGQYDRRETLTFALAHRFAVPDPQGRDDLELLREAVELSGEADFQRKRAQMYRWQDDVIQQGISDRDALEEMAQYVEEYNAATTQAVRKVYGRLAFTLVPVAMSALGGPIGALGAIGSIANLVRFWIFDRKPAVESGESQAAAMFYAVDQNLGWRQASLPPEGKTENH